MAFPLASLPNCGKTNRIRFGATLINAVDDKAARSAVVDTPILIAVDLL
jgi:hypothetical protein